MKAAVFLGPGQPLRVEDVPQPHADAGEVVIEVAYCGICGTDLHATEGSNFTLPSGTILGHEFSGKVVESGSASFEIGDRVLGIPLLACDECKPLGECRKALGICCDKNRIIGLALTAPGAYAQFVKLGEKHTLHAPDHVDLRAAALVEPLAVGAHSVSLGGPVGGKRVLVFGAGPIGLAVTASAANADPSALVVLERNAARREHALRLGAHAALDSGAEPPIEEIHRLLGGPPDVVFECVGVPGLIQKAIDVVAIRGTIAVVGVNVHADTIYPRLAMNKEVRIVFPRGYGRADFDTALDMLARGRVDVDAFITSEVALDQLPEVFESLRRPTKEIKVLVKPS